MSAIEIWCWRPLENDLPDDNVDFKAGWIFRIDVQGDSGTGRLKFSIRPWVLWALSSGTFAAIGHRAFEAVSSLWSDNTAFLAFPLTVLIPGLAFLFLATRPGMTSEEGVLMQLGTMVQLLLIIALPGFALYLALGFPVVFLVVELFETRFPATYREWLKKRVVAC